MHATVLVVHLLLALAIVGLVLLQRSEGGGLGGLGGGGGSFGGLVSAGGQADLLTRATGFCAAAFFATSLLLGILAGHSTEEKSILDALPAAAPPAVEAPAEPALPQVPVEG